MADEKKSGLLDNVRKRVAAETDALKAGAVAALKEKAAEIRQAIGPERMEPVIRPERPFGRDEGGEDVKQVVWTGHIVKTPEDHAYFGAVGLTQNGYYRAAEVRVYGSDELWRWQAERHTVKEDAISSAETTSANRIKEPDVAGARLSGMAEIPDDVKAQADRAAENVAAKMGRLPVQDMNTPQAVDNYADRGRELEAMREQKRQDAVQDKNQEPDRA